MIWSTLRFDHHSCPCRSLIPVLSLQHIFVLWMTLTYKLSIVHYLWMSIFPFNPVNVVWSIMKVTSLQLPTAFFYHFLLLSNYNCPTFPPCPTHSPAIFLLHSFYNIHAWLKWSYAFRQKAKISIEMHTTILLGHVFTFMMTFEIYIIARQSFFTFLVWLIFHFFNYFLQVVLSPQRTNIFSSTPPQLIFLFLSHSSLAK